MGRNRKSDRQQRQNVKWIGTESPTNIKDRKLNIQKKKSDRHLRQKVKWEETESKTDTKGRKLNGQKQKVRQTPKTES